MYGDTGEQKVFSLICNYVFLYSDSKFFQLCVDKLDNMITTHKLPVL